MAHEFPEEVISDAMAFLTRVYMQRLLSAEELRGSSRGQVVARMWPHAVGAAAHDGKDMNI